MAQAPPTHVETITLRKLDIAMRYPQELTEDTPRRRRGEHHVCPADGTPLVPVVLTTFGEMGDPSVWRAYPLAVDGWMCASDQHFEYAFITPEEVDQFFRSAMEAVRVGDFDRAEYFFRRVVSSWSGYATGRVNLGSLYLDRVKVAQSRSASPEEVRALLDVAVDQFERALVCKPPAPAEIRLMLGRIYARSDRADKARLLLEGLRGDPAVSQALKDQAKPLLDELGPPAASPLSPPAEAPPSPPAEALPSSVGAHIAHDYVQLSLPAGWVRVDAPGGYLAVFESPEHGVVNVLAAEAPAPCNPAGRLLASLEAHKGMLQRNYARCDAAPPEIIDSHADFVEARRHFQVQAEGPPSSVFARYVMAKTTLVRDGKRVHPYAQMVYYGSRLEPSKAVVDAITTAVILPVFRKGVSTGQASAPIVPYLVTSAQLERRDAQLVSSGKDPEGASGLLTLAPGVHLTVAIDAKGGEQPLFAADLASRQVALVDMLVEARRTIEARLGTAELPVHTYSVNPSAIVPIWREGKPAVAAATDTAKVLVVGPSWMAAGAAVTGALFQRARAELGTKALRLLIPHRDRVFVFAENIDNEAANKAFAASLVKAEADGANPISERMFALDTSGVTPAGRRALQWTVLSSRKGATRAEVEAGLPIDVKWRWADGQDVAPDKLFGEHWRSPPFRLVFEFVGGGLRAVRILGVVIGDFEAFMDLEAQLRQSLPDVEFTVPGKNPWDIDKARTIIENKGSEKIKMSTPMAARIPGFGDIHGMVFGYKKNGVQGYGIDLGYQPGRFFLEGFKPELP